MVLFTGVFCWCLAVGCGRIWCFARDSVCVCLIDCVVDGLDKCVCGVMVLCLRVGDSRLVTCVI